MAIDIWDAQGSVKWIFFLTSINYLLVICYFILAAILTAYVICNNKHGARATRTSDASSEAGWIPADIEKPMMEDNNQNHLLVDKHDSETHDLEKHDLVEFREPGHEIELMSKNRDFLKLSFPYKLFWILSNITSNMAILVAAIYWTMLHKGSLSPFHLYLAIDRHGINSMLVLVDFFLTRTACRLLHFTFTSVFIGLYFIYLITLWLTNDVIVYSHFDYNENKKRAAILIILSVTVAAPLSQILVFLLYRLKRFLFFSH